MIRYTKILFTLFIVIFLISACGSFGTKELKSAMVKIQPGFEYQETQFFFIIPDIGCAGCIAEVMALYRRHANDPRVFVIFTTYLSKKKIEIELMNIPRIERNVLFDQNNVMAEKEIMVSFPVLIKLKNGKIVDKVTLDPTDQSIVQTFEEKMN